MLKNQLLKYLKDNNIDYLLVNSTNEFLVEYNTLQQNARYHLTGFKGSTGEALLSKKGEIFLFVDGRYHKQADNEAYKSVQVVKLALGQSFLDILVEKLDTKKVLAIVSSKTSLQFHNKLTEKLKTKNIIVKILDNDPVFSFIDNKLSNKTNIVDIDIKITGKTTENKILALQKKLATNEAYLITDLQEIAYLLNKRAFCNNYSSFFNAKLIIEKNTYKVFYENDIVKFYQFLSKSNKLFIYFPQSLNYKDYLCIKNNSKASQKNIISIKKSVKNACELKHIKHCFEQTDLVMQKISDYINTAKSLTEQDIIKKLEKDFLANGAKSLSFNSIVASGKSSALAHYATDMNTSTKISKGNFILIDCGAYFDGGYATDITRTYLFGTPSAKQKKLYTTVLKAFLKAYNIKINKSISGFDIDKKARDTIQKINLKDFKFNHATGHGVGISVHESPPSISPSELAKIPLKAGMVFTIEPGCYNPNFGGVRLENTVYLTKKNMKYEIISLSKTPFEEKLIDYTMLTLQEKKWLKSWIKTY